MLYPHSVALLVVSLICLPICHGYMTYQDNIPNGAFVPHPCKPNYIWKGVGHQNVLGGGVRNPFGSDFKDAGYVWTTDLCNADSDGDGTSNGAELGDPNCVWTKGGAPENDVGLSHPGVCEPTESALCIQNNGWEIDCSDGLDYTCPGVGDADTVNVTLQITRTKVPSSDTTYVCQVFDIPSDKQYHLFGTKPIIDNPYVMHHTIMYGCSDEVVGFSTAEECGMATQHCETMLGAWTVGSNGECWSDDSGFLVGKGSFTKVLIEHHWNNPLQETEYYDESGLTLFLTPNLRTNNLGYMILGQESIELQPNEAEIVVGATCPGSCTEQKFSDTVYIKTAHLHMHYLGSAGTIEHWRNGELLNSLFSESVYSYDNPIFNEFDPPIEFRPGDELKTKCVFKTTGKDEITYFGEATSDEMCYSFLNFYPVENGADSCVSWEEYDQCEIEGNGQTKLISSFIVLPIAGLITYLLK